MEPGPGERLRILVVDDDQSSADALAALLREEGHDTAVVHSGAAAMALLGSGGCTLLVLDPALRDRTGPQVLNCAKGLGVPTIVTTSDPAFDPGRTRQQGVDGFLYKPIRLGTLLGLMAVTLGAGRPA